MRPAASFIGQPIRSLQTMLKVIAEQDAAFQKIIPDGIYGPETVAAISTFQKNHGLPVTGITDHQTWENVVRIFEDAHIHSSDPQPLQITLDAGQVIRIGEQHPHLHLAQAMLMVLADRYESISKPSVTGILDEMTADALSSFQALSGLPMTGQLDKHTWKHLVLQYPLAANLRYSVKQEM